MHHPEFREHGVTIAGVSRDRVADNLEWSRRLSLPYPLLSDLDGEAGHALGIMRRIGIGGWNVELLRRSTLLADADGRIAAVWADVRIRGHARDVLDAARALGTGARA